jgi:putative SOS response-associated peptidase YedK
MCYSAQIKADWARYRRQYGVQISLNDFYELYLRRAREDARLKVSLGVDRAFAHPATEPERTVAELIEEYRSDEATRLEQELFKQRRRLADAQRSLQTKHTKTATENERIATAKTEAILLKLGSLKGGPLTVDDERIFPGYYAPVIVMENGQRVVKPMRYQCRPAGSPAFYDRKFPGTYNARRDSLGGFWRDLFGFSHGVLVVSAFFENVDRDGRNAVLEFSPKPAHDMLVACLWSRWTAPGEPDLLSFAAITDEPPAEVAAAGHDRCIVPIKPENLDAWLNPDRADLAAQLAILDDRDRPYYEHRLAA